jgi:uncharacterized protein YbjQ (UPF0145 family)
MKKNLAVAVLLACSLTSVSAVAATHIVKMPIEAAMNANDAQARLGNEIKFYFGDAPTPKVLSNLGSDKTSQRTNGFAKSAEAGCNRAFLSAMLALEKHARAVGANGVIHIVSNFNNNESSSRTEFECGDGFLRSGGALKADIVKLAP